MLGLMWSYVGLIMMTMVEIKTTYGGVMISMVEIKDNFELREVLC